MFCNKCENEITAEEYHTLGGICEDCYDKIFRNDDYKSGSSAADYSKTRPSKIDKNMLWEKLVVQIKDEVRVFEVGKSGIASIKTESERVAENDRQSYINCYDQDGNQVVKCHYKFPHFLE